MVGPVPEEADVEDVPDVVDEVLVQLDEEVPLEDVEVGMGSHFTLEATITSGFVPWSFVFPGCLGAPC